MARVLITSGPTRQYLDPVRYLTNASSGKMGRALCQAALHRGHDVTVVTGPVCLQYPEEARVIPVVSTEEMLKAASVAFDKSDLLIGAAAPCDYRPKRVESEKIAKTGEPLHLVLEETPDIVATLGARKRRDQFVVGFALETDDHRFRALVKAERKSCDLMVLNRPAAMNADDNDVEVLHPDGRVLRRLAGRKEQVAEGIWDVIERELFSSPQDASIDSPVD